MIFSFLLILVVEACVGPSLAERNFELKYDYRYENRENPGAGKGVGFSNVYHRDLQSCLHGAESAFVFFKEGETDGFHLARLKLVCRDLQKEYDHVILEQ